MFKSQHVELILNYIKSFGKSDKSLKGILVEIINITKGMGQIEALNHFGIELARQKFSH